MIKNISLKKVASYGENEVKVSNFGAVNLFYGLNGTGKTTISRFLALGKAEGAFSNCRIDFENPNKPLKILAFNKDFIENNFLKNENGNLQGIVTFVLGKTNKEAKDAIDIATDIIKPLEVALDGSKQTHQKGLNEQKKEKTDKLSEIKSIKGVAWKDNAEDLKTDKNLKELADGGIGSSIKFWDKLLSAKHRDIKPSQVDSEIEKIKTEYEKIASSDGTPLPTIPELTGEHCKIEENTIFQEEIIASSNSYLSELIGKLQSSDWVKHGSEHYLDKTDNCPFCQQHVTQDLKNEIKSLFDGHYPEKQTALENLLLQYKNQTSAITISNENDFENIKRAIAENVRLIEEKIKNPSIKTELVKTKQYIDLLNADIKLKNEKNAKFNEDIKKLKIVQNNLKNEFWQVMAVKCSAEIEKCKVLEKDIKELDSQIKEIEDKIKVQKNIISENLAKTKNVQQAVDNINKRLKLYGFSGFDIQRHGEQEPAEYKITRHNKPANEKEFETLSEGEKNIIAFLYFVELCCGHSEKGDVDAKEERVIVIDDPISSLSFNSVFDIATLIKDIFLPEKNNTNKYKQVFILTHNLYFFHELLRCVKNNSKLFRVSKNSQSSFVKSMKVDEINNHYQSYWQIIKDASANETNIVKIMLPNAMRNILEHYFSFVHGVDNKILQKSFDEMKNKYIGNLQYQSFDRFVNRLSHSDYINIYDGTEIDVQKYLAFFKEIFSVTRHIEHYELMIGTQDMPIISANNTIAQPSPPTNIMVAEDA